MLITSFAELELGHSEVVKQVFLLLQVCL